MSLAVDIIKQVRAGVAPPPDLTISEWSDQYRVLSSESSAEPGRFSIERTPYMREIYDSIDDPSVLETWFMKSAQVGYSEMLNNVIGARVHLSPCPIMMLQPTIDMANAYSKDRISPMFRDTPVLKGLVDEKSRDRNSTLLHKIFPGGHLTLAGANSPASLASRPIKGILIDEPDRYPESAGEEGDPIGILRKRSTTFHDRFFFAGGTPTVVGRSRIEAGYNRGDRRLYHVPCPHCEELIPLLWEHLETDDESDHWAQYRCQGCKEWIGHEHKMGMLADSAMGGRARWVPTRPGRNAIRSYSVWEIYSPWVAWEEICLAFAEAKELGQQGMKVFYNTSLGRTYVETADTPDEARLLEHRRPYTPDNLPPEVRGVTAGLDTQDDRIIAEVVGWGRGEESWSIEKRIFWGDPEDLDTQKGVVAFLKGSRYHREDGREFPIGAALIDSGGHRKDAVYRITRMLRHPRMHPCKGSNVAGKPILASLSDQKKERVKLAMVGTDTAKEAIYAQLRKSGDGPGKCHFPMDYDLDYFRELTSEELVISYRQGRPTQKWSVRSDEDPVTGKVTQRENHFLDCRVYAKAALRLMPVSVYSLPKARKPTEKPKKPASKSRKPTLPRRKTWMGKTW